MQAWSKNRAHVRLNRWNWVGACMILHPRTSRNYPNQPCPTQKFALILNLQSYSLRQPGIASFVFLPVIWGELLFCKQNNENWAAQNFCFNEDSSRPQSICNFHNNLWSHTLWTIHKNFGIFPLTSSDDTDVVRYTCIKIVCSDKKKRWKQHQPRSTIVCELCLICFRFRWARVVSIWWQPAWLPYPLASAMRIFLFHHHFPVLHIPPQNIFSSETIEIR